MKPYQYLIIVLLIVFFSKESVCQNTYFRPDSNKTYLTAFTGLEKVFFNNETNYVVGTNIGFAQNDKLYYNIGIAHKLTGAKAISISPNVFYLLVDTHKFPVNISPTLGYEYKKFYQINNLENHLIFVGSTFSRQFKLNENLAFYPSFQVGVTRFGINKSMKEIVGKYDKYHLTPSLQLPFSYNNIAIILSGKYRNEQSTFCLSLGYIF